MYSSNPAHQHVSKLTLSSIKDDIWMFVIRKEDQDRRSDYDRCWRSIWDRQSWNRYSWSRDIQTRFDYEGELATTNLGDKYLTRLSA